MESTTQTAVTTLIEQGIEQGQSYQEYRALVSELVKENKSTGLTQSEALTNYSMLNDRRMKRLDKTLKIDEAIIEQFKNAETNITWLVLTEGWCGDAAQSLPVINKLAEANDGIDLKVISRDEHDELMNNFLTNGGKAIPKLIAYNTQSKEIVNSWGPRPSEATKMVNDYKEAHGKLDPEFKESLQVWYNKDKGKNIADDLSKLL
ncbi:thioredoxin family protein [Aquimarina rhabdastrellae]